MRNGPAPAPPACLRRDGDANINRLLHNLWLGCRGIKYIFSARP